MNRMSEAKAAIRQVYKANGYKEPYDVSRSLVVSVDLI